MVRGSSSLTLHTPRSRSTRTWRIWKRSRLQRELLFAVCLSSLTASADAKPGRRKHSLSRASAKTTTRPKPHRHFRRPSPSLQAPRMSLLLLASPGLQCIQPTRRLPLPRGPTLSRNWPRPSRRKSLRVRMGLKTRRLRWSPLLGQRKQPC